MQLDRFKGQKLSEFEAEFVASMIYFSRQKVDYVVLECGLGGELDATNAVSTTMYSIFTKIGLDHIGILGDTIQEIATTKSKLFSQITSPLLRQIKDQLHLMSFPKKLKASRHI